MAKCSGPVKKKDWGNGMTGLRFIAALLFMQFLIFSCSKKYFDPNAPLPETLEAAVDSDFRTPDNDERDEYQHPLETLQFFGVKEKMTVVEVSPGAGYFTEILAPFLSRKGQLVLALPRMPQHPPQFLIDNEKSLQEILMRQNEIQTKTKLIPFEPIDERNRTPKEFTDMILSFNNIHNMVAHDNVAESFQFFYDILKPGGTLGIVQHRVRKGRKKVPKSGYLYESEVIQMARRAGFKLVAKSEINANDKDKADYPDGVWTLPPFYRLGDKDHDRYEDIGESDRMTLKFKKQ